MGLIYERIPLGEIKGEKGEKGGAMGLGPLKGVPPPLDGHLLPSKGFSPTLLREEGLTPFPPHI